MKSQLDFDGITFYCSGCTENKIHKKKIDDLNFNQTYLSPTMSYQRFAVQGFLKKYVNEVKLFQRKVKYKRYFVLDNNGKKMRIHKTNDPQSDYKLFNFSDIQAVIFNKETPSQSMSIMERWSFKFHIVTSIREYELYAPSEDERELWLHSFFWITEMNIFQKQIMETQVFHNRIANVYN